MSRPYIIAGNWKMNKTVAESVALAKELAVLVPTPIANVSVVIAPTFLATASVVEAVKGSGVDVAVQDVHFENQGAFTGKVSVDMVKDLGVKYVILGHSEQRSYFGETDLLVNKKTQKVLAAGLTPIICIGETLDERNSGRLESVLTTQVNGAYADVSAEDAAKTVIAYEPVWAIGTGVTASDEQAQDAQALVRSLVANLYGQDVADKVVIQYGGSMKGDNALGLLGQKDIDGGLIGGAALKAETFIAIINAAKSV
jgi:triosephosphate isomerase